MSIKGLKGVKVPKMSKKTRNNALSFALGMVLTFPFAYAATTVLESTFVSYDNSSSGLSSETVQDAIDELYGMTGGCPKGYICHKEYIITYNLNGGTTTETLKTSYTELDQEYTLPILTKSGYEFMGWYENSNFSGNQVTQLSSGSTGDKTYYAKWKISPATFAYSGGIESYIIPETGVYKLEVWGAKGGGAGSVNGGYSVGYKILTAGTEIFICCGGNPYNGGGSGYSSGPGGGATHMALVTGTIREIGKTNFDKYGLIVAGGGGTSSWYGGAGGGLTTSGIEWGDTSWANCYRINGATQTGSISAASGNKSNVYSGGFGYAGRQGGGGYYGGGSAEFDGTGHSPAFGGVGWIGGVPTFNYNGTTYSSSSSSNIHNSTGKAIITFIES